MRNNRQFQQVLDAAYRAACTHHEQQDRLENAMMERYGETHGELDIDSLIDALNYGQGARVTVEEADCWMADAGHPKLTT